MYYKYLLESLFSIIWGIYPELQFLDHMVILGLLFGEFTIPFSTVAASFYIHTTEVQMFQFLHILANTFLKNYFCNSHSGRHGVVFHYGFDLYFLNG